MTEIPRERAPSPALQEGVKKAYRPPRLVRLGDVRNLTLGGSLGTTEAGGTRAQKPTGPPGGGSDRRIKTDIVRMGTHPLGIGLYLFRYLDLYSSIEGEGWFLGVMADEVENVLPEAVSVGPRGYKRVDYVALRDASPSPPVH